ncbi:MAG TPA: hypothetical protein VMZ06_12300 [Candidatus Bathyarchaeia archaeon]|nr:hypothetical protein [Candidatus Bathyarchaeia archaeon]
MCFRVVLLAVCGGLFCGVSTAQDVMGDVLMEKLVKPTNGAWAWYDLSDATSDQAFLMRLAIVGEERVGMKQGYWLEIEIVPIIGYRSVYKMLVTGPASDPKNLHKVLQRVGRGDVEEVPVDTDAAKEEKPAPEPERKLVGEEEVTIRDGSALKVEHYQVTRDGQSVDIWLNDEVRPMGIVKQVTPSGEFKLRNYGVGGQDARSVINDPLPAGLGEKIEDMKVEVGVVDPAEQPEAAPGEPAAPPQNPKTPKPRASEGPLASEGPAGKAAP